MNEEYVIIGPHPSCTNQTHRTGGPVFKCDRCGAKNEDMGWFYRTSCIVKKQKKECVS